jgi:Protein of unknown function (DUF2844)
MEINIAHPVRWIQLRMSAAVVVLLGFAIPALASLGGDLSSVEADRAHMNASTSVTQTDNYAVHQIQAPAGTVVNEYVSATGTVFAVAWHGQFAPDMQQILGTYFSQYSTALQSQEKHYGHRPLNIQQSGFVIQTGGHMRAYFGRAYVSALLPQGFNPDQLQ